MSKPLYLFCGRSASGKSTVENVLTSVGGYSSVISYTTRLKRSEDETTHIFVNEEQFSKLEEIMAYTKYNGYEYAATKYQIDLADIYTIDPDGIDELLKRYETDRKIVVIYFDTSICTRIDRMRNRHSPDSAIVSRLYTDEAFSWRDKLNKTVWHYKNNEDRDIKMIVIDANKDIDQVVKQIADYINNNKTGEESYESIT